MKSAEKRRQLEANYLNLFSLAMAMLRDADDAKDAVQEAMVKVLTTRHIKDVVGYSVATVRNEAINIIRRRSRVIRMDYECADDGAEWAERLRMVGRLRDELPDAQRALVELHDEEGYSFNELAVITGVPATTLRRRLDEAHETMKKRIEEEI